jgi:hypothetical protein
MPKHTYKKNRKEKSAPPSIFSFSYYTNNRKKVYIMAQPFAFAPADLIRIWMVAATNGMVARAHGHTPLTNMDLIVLVRSHGLPRVVLEQFPSKARTTLATRFETFAAAHKHTDVSSVNVARHATKQLLLARERQSSPPMLIAPLSLREASETFMNDVRRLRFLFPALQDDEEGGDERLQNDLEMDRLEESSMELKRILDGLLHEMARHSSGGRLVQKTASCTFLYDFLVRFAQALRTSPTGTFDEASVYSPYILNHVSIEVLEGVLSLFRERSDASKPKALHFIALHLEARQKARSPPQEPEKKLQGTPPLLLLPPLVLATPVPSAEALSEQSTCLCRASHAGLTWTPEQYQQAQGLVHMVTRLPTSTLSGLSQTDLCRHLVAAKPDDDDELMYLEQLCSTKHTNSKQYLRDTLLATLVSHAPTAHRIGIRSSQVSSMTKRQLCDTIGLLKYCGVLRARWQLRFGVPDQIQHITDKMPPESFWSREEHRVHRAEGSQALRAARANGISLDDHEVAEFEKTQQIQTNR